MPNIGKLTRTLGNERGAIGAGNPQIHTPEFKNWFGDWKKAPENASKVVDESGMPLVVYHGTRATDDFNVFDVKKSEDIKGAHFGDIDAANSFANGDNARIMPVYLNIKKPLEIEEDVFLNPNRTYLETAKALKYKIRTLYDNPLTKYSDLYDAARRADKAAEYALENREGVPTAVKTFFNKLKKYAKEDGYDGIKYQNEFEGATNTENYSYVAFDKHQIKSATGNSGAFSRTNPDIRGNTGAKMLAGTAAAGVGGITGYVTLKAIQNRNKNRR
jgi:hypothetical protein